MTRLTRADSIYDHLHGIVTTSSWVSPNHTSPYSSYIPIPIAFQFIRFQEPLLIKRGLCPGLFFQPSIPLSAKLTLVAQTHAKDLAQHYEFSPKNKCNPHSWSEKGNWSACCYNGPEQASCMWVKPKELTGYTNNGFEIAYYSSLGANAKEGLDGWKKSPGHNPILINSGSWKGMN